MLNLFLELLIQLCFYVPSVLAELCLRVPGILAMMTFMGSVFQDLADLGYKVDFKKIGQKYHFVLSYIIFIFTACSPAFLLLYVSLFTYKYGRSKQSFLEIMQGLDLLFVTTRLEDEIYKINPTKIGAWGLYLHPYCKVDGDNVISVPSKFKMDFLCYHLDENYGIVVSLATGKFSKLSEVEQRRIVFDHLISNMKSMRFLSDNYGDVKHVVQVDPILDGGMGFDVVDDSKLDIIRQQKLELIKERERLLSSECEYVNVEKGWQKTK